MPTTLKEGVCPLCKLVCHVNLSNSEIQEREFLLKSGVCLIFQKLGSNFTWSSTTWAKWKTTCDPCYRLIGEIVDLDKVVKETEEKICQKVGWISKLIEGNGEELNKYFGLAIDNMLTPWVRTAWLLRCRKQPRNSTYWRGDDLLLWHRIDRIWNKTRTIRWRWP